MNDIVKDQVFQTLNRITNTISQSPLFQKISHLVEINTAVVGGAIRDIYLNKSVKDIDITIGLNFNKNLKVNYPIRNTHNRDYDDIIMDQCCAEAEALDKRGQEVLSILGGSEFQFLHEKILAKDKPISVIQALVLVIQEIIKTNENYSIQQIFDSTTASPDVDMPIKNVQIRDSAYVDIGLCAVVSMKDKNSEYPIELLFTTDEPRKFLDSFDFDLCKILMENDNGKLSIVPTSHFMKDYNNMTITYSPNADVNETKMNKSLLVRYERLQKKLPEYKLITDLSNVESQDMKYLIEKTVNTVSLFHEVKAMPEKSDKKVSQRAKKI